MRVDIHTLRPGESLPCDLAESWRALRADSGPHSASPYFSHRYAEAVAATSPAPVHIALQRPRWGEPRALLAFQGRGQARPAGAPMSDYNGPLGTPEGGLEGFLQGAGIGALQSGGLVGGVESLDTEPVCRIDLREGHAAWVESRNDSYRRHIKGLRRRVRRATEEVGEPRATYRSRSRDDFNLLIAWKRAQFASTAKFDVLGGWPLKLLQRLWDRHDEPLRAELHALRLGDRPAAFDLGLTDGEVFHSWITAYDPELSNYAPGMQLLERLVEAAPDLGYRTVDLGVGLEGYKRHYTNVDARVGVGVVHASGGAHAAAAKLYSGAEARLEPLARLRRRYSQIAAVEPRWTARARALTEAMVGEATGRS